MVYATEGLGYAKRTYQEKLAAEVKQTTHLAAVRAINAMHGAPVRDIDIKAGHLIGRRIKSWEKAPICCEEYVAEGVTRCTEIATWKFAGEQDSWGIEWHYVCETHMIDAEKVEYAARQTWHCEKCNHKHGDKVEDDRIVHLRRWYDVEIPRQRIMCNLCFTRMIDEEEKAWQENGFSSQLDWDDYEDECVHNGIFANGDGKAKFCPHCSTWVPEREL